MIINSSFALTLFCFCVLFPIFVHLFLQSRFLELDSEYNKKTYGAIYSEVKTDSKAALLQCVYFLLRRLFFSLVALTLSEYPYAQIQSVFITSIIYIIFVGTVKPFETRRLNQLEIFNELCILIASYHMIVFTDFVDNQDIQYLGGWSLIAVILFNMIVNLYFMIKTSLM